MSKLKVTTISDPDNNNTALTVASDGKVTLAQDTTFSGNVGIGTSSPAAPLHIAGDGANPTLIVGNTTETNRLEISADINGGVTFDQTDGGTARNIKFALEGTEAMRIDSSGNLLVGTTNTDVASNNVEGISLSAGSYGGYFAASRVCPTTSAPVMRLNRKDSDGDIAKFLKDGSTVGSIGNSSTNLNIDASSSNRSGIALGGGIVPRYNQANSDNTVDLGNGTYRFKNLYLSGGAYIGGTGSANYLDDYEEGTWTPGILEGTASTKNAEYRKIGGIVHIWGYITGWSDTTSNLRQRITGLPFTPAEGRINGSAMWEYVDTDGRYGAVYISSGGELRFYDDSRNSGFDDIHCLDMDGSQTAVYFQATYHTNS